jgi:hypothetical protein
VARKQAGPGPAVVDPDVPGRNTRRQQRWLGVLSLIQPLLRPLTDQLPEVEAHHLRGLFEPLLDFGKVLRQRRHHADGLRALAGEDKAQ